MNLFYFYIIYNVLQILFYIFITIYSWIKLVLYNYVVFQLCTTLNQLVNQSINDHLICHFRTQGSNPQIMKNLIIIFYSVLKI